jgi:predicted O-linked N-acetylglucosamine transferase (SPINDLY family)
VAIRIGRAPEALAQFRATQRARVASSPACDPASLCRELEAIYRAEADMKL